MLREFDDDGFVVMTDARSQKVKDMVNINLKILKHLLENLKVLIF